MFAYPVAHMYQSLATGLSDGSAQNTEAIRAVDILCGDENAMPCSGGMSYSGKTNMSGNDEVPVYPNPMNISYLPRYLIRYGKEDFAKAVYISILIPVIMRVYELLFPDIASLTDDIVLDAVCMIIIASMGQALLFYANAFSGGLDIVAKILNKYFHIELGHAITIAGGLVILSSVFVYDTKTLIVGAVTTYFNGLVVNEYVGNFMRKKKICIISREYAGIQRYIVSDINNRNKKDGSCS